MGDWVFILLGFTVTTILVWSFISKNATRNPMAVLIIVFGLVVLVTTVRALALIAEFQLLEIYALALVGVGYFLSFFSAIFLYKDPAILGQKKWQKSGVIPPRVLYVVPVHNEVFVGECIKSIIRAANFVMEAIPGTEVHIVIVDDASTDSGRTRRAINKFSKHHLVQILYLSKNAGKKGALAAGTCGGENWRDGYELFALAMDRDPGPDDSDALYRHLRIAGCDPWEANMVFYTDSDSVIRKDFIFLMIAGFESDPRIGAISGHCDVWQGDKARGFVTKMQVAWYSTQFSVRKAAESAFGAVFCVSGPGAAFRTKAVLPNLVEWVDDWFGGKIYRGATDRKLTLLILQAGFKVVYSQLAKVETIVPENFEVLKKQWTRWKQNFWRMFIPVWQYAWHVHPVVAYMTYARLLVTVLAPIILGYQLIAFLLGDWASFVIYLGGIAFMGSLMGLSFVARNPSEYRFALYRIVISLVSAMWGSVLTVGALVRTLNNSFVWREKEVAKKGRIINRWFKTPIEVQFLEVILIILIAIRLFRLLS